LNIIYFDQTNIPIVTYPLNTPSSNPPSSSYEYDVKVTNVIEVTTIFSVGFKTNPQPLKLKPYRYVSNNNLYLNIYLNGYLTDFSFDQIFSPSYYDINHKVITKSNLKDITKILILNPFNTNKSYPNKLSGQLHILSHKPSETINCNNNKGYESTIINLKDQCYPPNTQLTWIGNPDSSIVDYSKPYTIFKLYDANNNEIENNPANYYKVTQIAYFMSDKQEPYPPFNYTPIFIGIFIFVFIILLYVGFMYASTPSPTPVKPINGGYFLLGE